METEEQIKQIEEAVNELSTKVLELAQKINGILEVINGIVKISSVQKESIEVLRKMVEECMRDINALKSDPGRVRLGENVH